MTNLMHRWQTFAVSLALFAILILCLLVINNQFTFNHIMSTPSQGVSAAHTRCRRRKDCRPEMDITKSRVRSHDVINSKNNNYDVTDRNNNNHDVINRNYDTKHDVLNNDHPTTSFDDYTADYDARVYDASPKKDETLGKVDNRLSQRSRTIKQRPFGIDTTFPKTPYDRLKRLNRSRVFQAVFHGDGNKPNGTAQRRILADLVDVLTTRTGVVGKQHLRMKGISEDKIRTPQSELVLQVLGNKRHGTFVECGAFDGETASNTMELEYFYDWKGVLIEPNPFYYSQVVGKNRQVYAVNACLSPESKPTLMSMSLGGCAQTCKTMNSSASEEAKDYITIPCLPFFTILQSLQLTTIHYFSLDVEGAEYDILRTIPFEHIDIKTLSVEHKHGKVSKQTVIAFMDSKGYLLYKELHSTDRKRELYVDDLFFVKKTLIPRFLQ